MLTVLSPAKTLDYETPLDTLRHTLPRFNDDSQVLIDTLAKLSVQDVAKLMKLSDKLASLNVARYASWQPDANEDNARQAVLAFQGDVYTGLNAATLTHQQLDFAQQHVRILSGLYGVLRPLDLMQPYRLEMGTKLTNPRGKDLYQFWGETLTDSLAKELAKQDVPVLINLASQEYFKSVQPKKLAARVITPIFKDWKNGQYKIISFYAKKARGLMTRYLIENTIDQPDDLKGFDYEGYRFCPASSSENEWIFTRQQA